MPRARAILFKLVHQALQWTLHAAISVNHFFCDAERRLATKVIVFLWLNILERTTISTEGLSLFLPLFLRLKLLNQAVLDLGSLAQIIPLTVLWREATLASNQNWFCDFCLLWFQEVAHCLVHNRFRRCFLCWLRRWVVAWLKRVLLEIVLGQISPLHY